MSTTAARTSLCGSIAAVFLTSLVPAAAEVAALYTAEVAINRETQAARADAYRQALFVVLRRVAGGELVRDPNRVAALFPDPAAYVLRFRPGPDDRLFVSFDGEALEAVLKAAGQTVWGADRPATLVWLAVDWGDGDRGILGADDPLPGFEDQRAADGYRRLRERVFTLAERRGLPVLLPLLDAQELARVTFADLRGGFDEIVLESSRRYDVSSILIGLIDASGREAGRWRHYLGGERTAMLGEPEQIVPQVADRLSRAFAVRGDTPLRALVLTVSGVRTVEAFGELQQQLGGIEVIERFAIEEIVGDTIRYSVELRGGARRLARALRLAGFLESEGVIDALDAGTAADAAVLEFFYQARAAPRD